MSPSDIVQDMINSIQAILEKMPEHEKDVKVFTAERHYNSMLQFAKGLKAAIDVGSYELTMQNIDGEEEVVDGISLKRTELEDLIIMQPVKYCTDQEHAEIMEGLSLAYDKGALNNKCMLVLPYDIRILKAKLEK
jgi:hypothetical protein